MQHKDFENAQLMWTPKGNSGKKVQELREKIRKKYKTEISDDYWDLHRWTVEHIPEFWAEVWDIGEIIHSKTYDEVIDLSVPMENNPEWFRGARLNYSENILKHRDDRVALILAGEDREKKNVTYAQMYKEACRYGAAFRKCGLKKGDRVVCYMSNREEPVYAMMGAVSVGAIWGGALPLLGSKAVLSRFKSVEPKFLFTIDRFKHGGEEREMLKKVQEIANELPSLEKVVIVPSKEESKKKDISQIRNSCFLDEFLEIGVNSDGSVPDLKFEQLPFNHPLFVSYTSGTTGDPKALVHGIGGLLSVLRDFWLHGNSPRDSTQLSMSPVGWASWNCYTSLFALGVKMILFEGVPYFISPTFLWDMVDEFKITNLVLTPNVLDELEKRGYLPTEKNHLSSLKGIYSGASVVKPQNYEFVYTKIKSDIVFGSAYGSTEIMGACLLIDQSLPIYKGELPTPAFGASLRCYNDEGKHVVGELGELVITAPTPSLPLGMWGDKDGELYRKTYFSKFKGVFTTGDICIINPVTKGFIFYGRSDETLKPRGTRFGSSEIYNVVNVFPEVKDSICVSQYNRTRDERAVLFLKLKHYQLFTEDLIWRIREAIARELSRDHVPDVILEVKDIPYNMNGKKMEILVKKIINGLPYNPETVINPECLQCFNNIPELQNF